MNFSTSAILLPLSALYALSSFPLNGFACLINSLSLAIGSSIGSPANSGISVGGGVGGIGGLGGLTSGIMPSTFGATSLLAQNAFVCCMLNASALASSNPILCPIS